MILCNDSVGYAPVYFSLMAGTWRIYLQEKPGKDYSLTVFLTDQDQIAVATVANFDQWKDKTRKQIIEDVSKNIDNLAATLAGMWTAHALMTKPALPPVI